LNEIDIFGSQTLRVRFLRVNHSNRWWSQKVEDGFLKGEVAGLKVGMGNITEELLKKKSPKLG
jgi:hypothetical protein